MTDIHQPPSLLTERLELIAATATHLDAELGDRAKLSAMLDAWFDPKEWPPPLVDDGAFGWCRDFLAVRPGAVGWTLWYVVATNPTRQVVGLMGFKGTPNGDGLVEIGYSLIPSHQGRGLGTEALKALLDWAFAHDEIQGVLAQTFPELDASLALLHKLGFHEVGEGDEPRTIRFLRERESIGR